MIFILVFEYDVIDYGRVVRDINVLGVVEYCWFLVSFCVFDELFVISLIVEFISRCYVCR